MMMHQWQINLVKFCHLDELDEKSFNSLLSFPFLCYPKRQMTLTVDDDGRILRKYKKEIIQRRKYPEGCKKVASVCSFLTFFRVFIKSRHSILESRMKKGTLKDTAVVFGSVIKNPASFSFDYIVFSILSCCCFLMMSSVSIRIPLVFCLNHLLDTLDGRQQDGS